MEKSEILSQLSTLIEQSGVKEELKKPETIEKVYEVLSSNGLNVPKESFTAIVQGLADSDGKLDLEQLTKIGASAGLLGNLSKLFS